MNRHESLSKEDPRYQARLRAQHGLVIAAGLLPAGVVGGLMAATPLAQRTVGAPISLLATGVPSVLALLGLGLLALGAVQGALRLVPGFWNLRHSLGEISTDQRLAWYTALAGLFFLGLGVGFALAFYLI